MKDSLFVSRKAGASTAVLFSVLLGMLSGNTSFVLAASGIAPQRISLGNSVLAVDASEPTYVQYAAKDLAGYLTEISGKPVRVSTSADEAGKARSVIAIGEKMARAVGADSRAVGELGDQESVIRSFEKGAARIVIVAGHDPHGTNTGVATLMQMVRAEGKTPYLEGPLDLHNKPSFSVRGIHLNGWPLNDPYGFRTWKEENWKRFVDIAWAQRINLFYLWPFMEIIPVPLSSEDEAYLQEVHRIVDYAKNQRGMEVWIMQSANRIAVSDCGTRDPRFRTYWVNDCQKDMNPADPQQFERILKSFEALYRIVNNADAFCMIDSDPGGWPNSPLSDQVKIFQGARKLLDRYNVHAEKTKLVDWMWLGWGRDAHGAMSREDRVAFMAQTIQNFKKSLPEPWEMIAGMTPYLESSKREFALNQTVYLPYGAIEMEPAFPATNMGLEPVRKAFDDAAEYPDLKGVMGNNELMLLQFPRTFYFFKSAWNTEYKKCPEQEMLLDLSQQLYPDHKELIAGAFLALRETDPEKLKATLAELKKLVQEGNVGRPGTLSRFLFPDRLAVARNLQLQLEIRLARQSLIQALHGKPDISECAKLIESYFDKLLAWNKETGWDKMIDITIWRTPIYERDKDLTQAMSRLKQILGEGAPYTRYAQEDAFFDRISKDLLQTYGQNSVMIGCIEPFKLAVIQGK